MHLLRKKQSQFELFPGSSEPAGQGEQQPRLFKDLTVTPENTIVLGIILIMILVLSFAWGVERGRSTVAQNPVAANDINDDPSSGIVISTKTAKEITAESDVSAGQEPKVKEEILEIPIDIKEDLLAPRYTIQIASFKLKSNAEKEADKLELKDQEIFVLPKGNYSIVCVGKFGQRQKAKEVAKTLNSRYRDYLIRRL